MVYSYRPLTENDLRATYEIRFSVTQNLIHGHQVKYLQRDHALEDIRQGGGWMCVADGREVGFCMPLFIPEPYLAALFVVPEHQGKGVGGALLELALKWLKEKGGRLITLETDPGSVAEGFYKNRGWEKTGMGEFGIQNVYVRQL
ncbi:GNAT family N-acetyltransferase [Paraburkholderia megapolitana]|nr:GNAT family N-acetyltransferase [Paraburkholderia megapolitana]QDQ82238.1 GNAT family N-acetyltransferase [Paraburkholderia megapolitana]